MRTKKENDLADFSFDITKHKEMSPFWNKETMPLFLKRTDVNYCKADLNKFLFKDRDKSNRLLASFLVDLPEGAYIAGGFPLSIVRGTKDSNDIDFFFTSQDAFVKTLDKFLHGDELDSEEWAYAGYEPADQDLILNLNSVQEAGCFKVGNTYEHPLDGCRFVKFVHPTRPPVQLIKLVWYDSPEHVIDSFDFTCVQFILDKKSIWFSPYAAWDVSEKRLKLHRVQFPHATFRRLIKYAGRGFYADKSTLVELGGMVKTVLDDENFTDDDDFYRQKQGSEDI